MPDLKNCCIFVCKIIFGHYICVDTFLCSTQQLFSEKSGFFCRNLFTKKAKTSNSVAVATTSDSIQAEPRIGFQLFNALGKLGKGKFEMVKANGTVNKDTTRKLDDNKQAVRKQDISVPSTTALILQERPQ